MIYSFAQDLESSKNSYNNFNELYKNKDNLTRKVNESGAQIGDGYSLDNYEISSNKGGEEDYDNDDYTNIQWLFSTGDPLFSLIGVNTLTQKIWAIDNEGEFFETLNCLQDIPYDIIRNNCYYTDSETTEEYFEQHSAQQYRETLQEYEKWCQNNAIELDKDKIYHNNDGQLFSKYFQKYK